MMPTTVPTSMAHRLGSSGLKRLVALPLRGGGEVGAGIYRRRRITCGNSSSWYSCFASRQRCDTSTTAAAAAAAAAAATVMRRESSSSLVQRQLQRRLQHTVALTRQLPNSFDQALSQHYEDANNTDSSDENNNDSEPNNNNFDLAKARAQHETYVSELQSILPTVVLPALEDYPDCCFVEDTVIAIGSRALLTHPGHESRQGEVSSIRNVLQDDLGMEVVEMNDPAKTTNKYGLALCDGGDVMFTGRHLFVGVSERTNEEALTRIEAVFPDVPLIPVAPVAQGKYVLHLKSLVTHLDERTLLLPTAPMGHKTFRAMRAQELGYDAIWLPDVLSCNAVVVEKKDKSKVVLVQDSDCETSRQRLQQACEERNMELRFVDTSEMAKKDAALTCCSVLLDVAEEYVPQN